MATEADDQDVSLMALQISVFFAKPRTYSKIMDGAARIPLFLQSEIARHANLNLVWFLPTSPRVFSEKHSDAVGIEPGPPA